jgi:group II intron reverse transcriptase/maturase
MQTAEQILQALRNMGEKGTTLTRVYRSLYSEDLFLRAYDKIRRNDGAMTPGADDNTADGMSIARARKLIEQLRYERFNFRPVRRGYQDKKNGGKRPIGKPNFDEKLVQEAVRAMLEAYYEPRFRESSHGFRPERGCHTALTHIHHRFRGSTWFIEGDIKGCFDNIDHDILMNILSRNIQDGRLLNLIQKTLKAGALEEWKFLPSFEGTPQGGVLSPLLANIYLNELDVFIEDVLIPQYTRGKKRRDNPEYKRLSYQIAQARKRGDQEVARELELARRELPSGDPRDPNYRRLTYCRYADDFILGFIGPKAEAEAIKTAIKDFLWERLKLQLSEEKTLITHARSSYAHFLGYAVSIYHSDSKLNRNATDHRIIKRSVNGHVRLGVPHGLVDEYIKDYMQNGKVISERRMTMFSDAHIVATYQGRYRGIVEYYKYAVDRHRWSKLKYVMETALTKTLAHKYKLTVSQVYKRYRSKKTIDGQAYKILLVEVPTEKGVREIYWGAIPLKVVAPGSETIEDTKHRIQWTNVRSDLITRLQANTCELCGSQQDIEVHHVRKLSNLKQKWAGRRHKPRWIQTMIALNRKTLVVCLKCHRDIHAGRPTPNKRS